MDDVERDVVMTAQIVILANVRAARAKMTVRVDSDPYASFWAWYCYLTGDKPKAREPKTAEVRAFGGDRQ